MGPLALARTVFFSALPKLLANFEHCALARRAHAQERARARARRSTPTRTRPAPTNFDPFALFFPLSFSLSHAQLNIRFFSLRCSTSCVCASAL
eukprot:3031469-Pleurochrysis_carterae.AAC.2